MSRSIYLIGFSGTGKTTAAAALGARLGRPHYDLDRLIVERAGLTIPEIFAQEGEPGFRSRESAALRALAAAAPCVVATGGGAPLRAENRDLMATGWVIALEGRPETLHARLARQQQGDAPDVVRPLLAVASPLDHIRALKADRQPIYALADWTIHTDRLSPAQVLDELVRAVALLEGLAAAAT